APPTYCWCRRGSTRIERAEVAMPAHVRCGHRDGRGPWRWLEQPGVVLLECLPSLCVDGRPVRAELDLTAGQFVTGLPCGATHGNGHLDGLVPVLYWYLDFQGDRHRHLPLLQGSRGLLGRLVA